MTYVVILSIALMSSNHWTQWGTEECFVYPAPNGGFYEQCFINGVPSTPPVPSPTPRVIEVYP